MHHPRRQDRLHSDPRVGSIRRITRARHALNVPSLDPHVIHSDIASAKKTLKRLLHDREEFPRASWW